MKEIYIYFAHKMLKFLLTLTLLLMGSGYVKGNTIIDSIQVNIQQLVQKKTNYQKDTAYILLLTSLANEYRYVNPDTSLELSRQALRLGEKIGYDRGMGCANRVIAIYHREKGNHAQAIWFLEVSIAHLQKAKDIQNLAFAYNSLAAVYDIQNKILLALEYCHKALEAFEKIRDERGSAYVLNQICDIYVRNDINDKALEYAFRTLEINQKVAGKRDIFYSYYNIAHIYQKQKKYKEALEYQYKSLEIAKEVGYQLDIIYALQNIANIYIDMGETSKVLSLLAEGKILAKKTKNAKIEAELYASYAKYYNLQKNYSKALEYSQMAVKLAHQNIVLLNVFIEIYKEYSIASYQMKQYKVAAEAHMYYKKLSDSLQNQKNYKLILMKEYEYEKQKKQVEQEAKQIILKNELEDQKMIRNGFLIGFLLMGIAAFSAYYSYTTKQKANMLLEKQKEEISLQKQSISLAHHTLSIQKTEIEKSHQDIVDSLNAARRIQQTILPTSNMLEEAFNNQFFVLYKPKDIVSGDFYWFHENKSLSQDTTTKFIIVGDCTGHGVPGAFMSVIGNELLNEIILVRHIQMPHEILNELCISINRTLSQDRNGSKEGMDIAIVVIQKDSENTILYYAGAMNPMYYIQNNNFIEIKANKKPIGGEYGRDSMTSYILHTIPINEPTFVYLCTDGYQDQFGGEKNKKFMGKKLKETLKEIHSHHFATQQEILNQTFENWKGNHEQIDDVTIVGFSVLP